MNEKVMYVANDNPMVSMVLFPPEDTFYQECIERDQLKICTTVSKNCLIRKIPVCLKENCEKAFSAGWSGLFFALDIETLLKRTLNSIEVTRLEARLNHVFRNNRCRGLCLYDYGKVSESLLLHAIATHPFVAAAGVELENPFFLLPPPFLGQESPRIVLRHLIRQIFSKSSNNTVSNINGLTSDYSDSITWNSRPGYAI